jgi:hypothetical protein
MFAVTNIGMWISFDAVSLAVDKTMVIVLPWNNHTYNQTRSNYHHDYGGARSETYQNLVASVT